ncbi:hypothetical protein FRC01_000882, partial [Tulasnella sp. 417]
SIVTRPLWSTKPIRPRRSSKQSWSRSPPWTRNVPSSRRFTRTNATSSRKRRSRWRKRKRSAKIPIGNRRTFTTRSTSCNGAKQWAESGSRVTSMIFEGIRLHPNLLRRQRRKTKAPIRTHSIRPVGRKRLSRAGIPNGSPLSQRNDTLCLERRPPHPRHPKPLSSHPTVLGCRLPMEASMKRTNSTTGTTTASRCSGVNSPQNLYFMPRRITLAPANTR